MKIYHTETQADFDALMIELEEQGYKWAHGDKPTEWEWLDEIWDAHRGNTCVGAESNKQIQWSDIDYCEINYPDTPIIKYKAKTEKGKLGLPEWAEWITRDEDGELWIHAEEPYITDDYWDSEWNQEKLDSELFLQVKWEDQKPTKVSDLTKTNEIEKAFRNAGQKIGEAIEAKKKGVDNKMNQVDKAKRHKEITEELNNIYVAKNHDYGDSFGETFKKLGIISAVTRITDKVNRLQSLSTKPQEEQKVKDESIKDSFYDLANYAIMSIIELESEEE